MDYEVGLKSILFGRLLLNVTAYWETFKNFQVQSFADTDVPGVGTFLIQNAGSLRARGIEGNFSWRAGGGLTLSGGGAYNNATYRRFQGAPCFPGQTAAQGCIAGAVDASGNRLVNAPRWTGTLAADYETPVGSTLRFVGHADGYARSRVNFQPNGDPNTVQRAYGVVNGSLGIGDIDKRWLVSVFCRNCGDKRFVTFIESNPGGSPGDYGQSFALDSFRTLGVKVSTHF